MARILAQATMTGAFCIGFALVVNAVTDALSLAAFVALSFASGFLGSLFAQLVLRRGASAGSAAAGPER